MKFNLVNEGLYGEATKKTKKNWHVCSRVKHLLLWKFYWGQITLNTCSLSPKFAKEKLQGISRSIAEILPQLSAGNYQILSLFSRLSGDQEKISNKS